MAPRIRPRDLDIVKELPWPRVQAAAHELGHWLAYKDLPDARVLYVKLWGSARNPQGEVTMRWPDYHSPHLDKGYLIGLLAGQEADKLWATATGTARLRGGSGHDMAQFHKARRLHEPSRQWSESRLRGQARDLVLSRWDELVRHVPRLAANGRL